MLPCSRRAAQFRMRNGELGGRVDSAVTSYSSNRSSSNYQIGPLIASPFPHKVYGPMMTNHLAAGVGCPGLATKWHYPGVFFRPVLLFQKYLREYRYLILVLRGMRN
eukprot:1351233-Rhodomonas_salina.2